jgi:hypothetical protein
MEFLYFHFMPDQPATVFQVKRSPLGTRRDLTIDPLYLEFEGPLANTRFTKEDIEAFRFGVSGFRYSFFTLNKSYNIEVKNSQGKIMLIRMHSIFGIGSKKIQRLFIKIHNQIQRSYFNDMAIHYVRLLKSGLTYELAGVMLTNEGILLRKDNAVVPWFRIGLKNYFQSCSIYDLGNPQHVRSFDYWHDWNASLLRAVVDYKIRSNDTFEIQK